MDSKFREEIRRELINEYPEKTEEKIEVLLCLIEKTLNPVFFHLISVCSPKNGKAEVDVALLRALLRAENENTRRRSSSNLDPTIAQLRLALEWNRVDICIKYIFSEKLKDNVKFVLLMCFLNFNGILIA